MKKVAVIIRSPPHGKYLSSEGLRIATALTLLDLDISVIAIEDGVYNFLKDVDMSTYKNHLDYLFESGIKIILDEDSMTERGLTKADIIENATMVPHGEIVKTVSQCFTTLIF
ncbi:MAG: DsrE family protein [Candidatus Njordarchaeia archaeon]